MQHGRDQLTENRPPDHDFSHLANLDQCPPSDASPARGVFFAFHDSNPPGEEDFQTAAESGAFANAPECKRHSNSIWSDLDALKAKVTHLRKTNPLRYRYFSKAELKPEDGLLGPSKTPHFSFWVCRRTSMHRLFRERVS